MISLKNIDSLDKTASKGINLREFILHLAILLLALRAIQGGVHFLLAGSFLGCVLLLIGALKKERTTITSFFVMFIFIVSYVFTLLNNAFSNGVLFLFLMFGAYGISWELCKRSLSLDFASFLFYASSATYLFLYFVLGYSEGEILNHSRNHVSVYFINLTILLFVALNDKNIVSPAKYIVPASITVFISIVAVGISGILSSVLLFTVIFLATLKKIRTSIAILLIFVSALFLSLIFYYSGSIGDILSLDRELLGKLRVEKFTSDPRIDIWAEYILSLDWIRFITGVPLSEVFSNHQNLHSSYFLLHERIGVFSFAVFVIFLISLVKIYKLNKFLFAGLLSILVRGLSDTTFLSASPFDFLLFYLVLFYPYKNSLVFHN